MTAIYFQRVTETEAGNMDRKNLEGKFIQDQRVQIFIERDIFQRAKDGIR